MQYLVTTKNETPFFTNYFDSENHFNADLDMVVYDLQNGFYTTDGVIWHNIEEDHL